MTGHSPTSSRYIRPFWSNCFSFFDTIFSSYWCKSAACFDKVTYPQHSKGDQSASVTSVQKYQAASLQVCAAITLLPCHQALGVQEQATGSLLDLQQVSCSYPSGLCILLAISLTFVWPMPHFSFTFCHVFNYLFTQNLFYRVVNQ